MDIAQIELGGGSNFLKVGVCNFLKVGFFARWVFAIFLRWVFVKGVFLLKR